MSNRGDPRIQGLPLMVRDNGCRHREAVTHSVRLFTIEGFTFESLRLDSQKHLC